MLFLAFQEYIGWYGTTLAALNSTCFKQYLQSYQTFCHIHHLCDNLYDVTMEWRNQKFSEN